MRTIACEVIDRKVTLLPDAADVCIVGATGGGAAWPLKQVAACVQQHVALTRAIEQARGMNERICV